MKQFTFRFESLSEFEKWADYVKTSEEYTSATQILMKVYTLQFPEYSSRDIHRRMKEYFPKAAVVGISMTTFINDIGAGNTGDDPAWAEDPKSFEPSVIVSCIYFSDSSITLLENDGNHVDDFVQISAEMNGKLKEIPNLKAVEIFSAGGNSRLSMFMDIVTAGLDDVPFFGAEAGAVNTEKITCKFESMLRALHGEGVTQFVTGEEYHKEGIVLIAYSGENLNVMIQSLHGWTPLGKEMTVTETLGINGLSKIDGKPAVEVYKKYLNIEPNDYLLFNTYEFPLIVDRNGMYVGRSPSIYDEYGRLYFGSDIRNGEKIRLSYGNPTDILKETFKASGKMREFAPEAIMLTICGARTVFLGSDAGSEINDYLRFHQETVACFGNSELYKYKGKGGQLNGAFIATGMREGEIKEIPEIKDFSEDYTLSKPSARQENIVPLSKRLATFLEVMTGELQKSNLKFKDAALAARQASKAKSQFLSNMSHEIRTPINAILGMNEMILRESTEPTILEYAENIQAAGNSLLGIVNDILDFSKIEAGKMDIIPVEYGLSSLLNDLINMIQKRAEKKGLQLQVNADTELPSELFGDEIRIKQIITNILTNAVKYTEKGYIALNVYCKKIDEEKIKLCVSVEDTGIGIKPEDIKKLYSAFERIEEKRNRSIEGTGLGMNITQRLLAMMGSELKVESVYGKGSVFGFEIEQKVMNWQPLGDFMENYRNSLGNRKAYREKFDAPDARILVVDDTVMNLTVVKGLLKQTKVQIDTAESGYECLTAVTRKHYDIIFLDHRMPGIDGIETLKRMKELPGNLNTETPVISLTANAVSGARKQYIDAGFQDYLTKPIDSAKLEMMMINYLPKEKVHIVNNDGKEEIKSEPAEIPDWLKDVEGIETTEGIKNCGSVEGYIDALTVFAQSVLSGSKEIANFYREKDWKNYTVKVHALKSSARVIGAKELSDRAKRLEYAGNAGYVEEIENFTDGMLELYISFADKLKPLIAEEKSDEGKPLIGADELAEAYEAFREFAGSFDYDSMMFTIQSLEEYRLPEEEKEKFKALKAAASKPDWEEVGKILKR